MNNKKFTRDISNGYVAGVCSGIAKYANIDVTLVRLVTLFLLLMFGSAAFAYIILWICIPKK